MRERLLRPVAMGALFIGLVVSGGASAQLSEVELVPGSGDSRVTFDAASGLYWLDLTETTNLSVPDVLGGAGGWVVAGWRYATATEICALFASYALAVPSCGTFQSGLAAGDVLGTLQGFLGLNVDDGTSRSTFGFYDDFGDPARVGVARLIYQVSIDQSTSLVQNSNTFAVALPNFGNWLVRDTPPPAPVPGMGMVGRSILVALLVSIASAPGRRRSPSLRDGSKIGR